MNTALKALVMALLFLATAVHAQDRFMRYRLLEPSAQSIASISVHAHDEGAPDFGIGYSWAGIAVPGYISNHGLFVSPGDWSPWRRLPAPPFWGHIRMNFHGAEPIKACKVEIQVATRPEDNAIARTVTISAPAGSVGFTIPPDVLKDPDLVESFPEDFARRRKVADSVAVPEERRPKLLRFGACQIDGDPTVPDSAAFELETAYRLGLNLSAHPKALYSGSHKDHVSKMPPEQQSRCAAIHMSDEPDWSEGVDHFWAQRGDAGFHEFLKTSGVTLERLGAKTWDEVRFIRRDKPIPVGAPLEQRRVWYWSCRYTMVCHSRYWLMLSTRIRETFPDAPTYINYSSHRMGILGGALGSHPDVFEDGRQNTVGMNWSEDWIAPWIDSWGDGMYQKVAYLGDILRGAGRYQGFTPTRQGFHVIGKGWGPKNPGTDNTAALRVLLLLQQGCKTFQYFNYGPTLRATVDHWADDAAMMRGVADTSRLVGGEEIEPYLWEGVPVQPQVALIYSVENFFWLEANQVQADEYERQWFYCMLQQNQIPVDLIAGLDLARFIKDYRAVYVLDRNLVAASAVHLKSWVDAGGVLVLGPEAALFDEVNEPLAIFPAEPGRHRVGQGWVVRFKEREGRLWREASAALNRAAGAQNQVYGRNWYAQYDAVHRDIVCNPALELAGVRRPVMVNVPDIVAEPLVSERGVAVPLVNLRGMFEKGGSRYLNLKVTLADGEGLERVVSSRRGELPMQREGDALSVILPLDCTDILVFSRKPRPARKTGIAVPIAP